jgi:hypothetical protein
MHVCMWMFHENMHNAVDVVQEIHAHTYICLQVRNLGSSYLHVCSHTFCERIHAYTHICGVVGPWIHAYIPTYTYTVLGVHIYTYTCIHTRMQCWGYIHTRIHTHTRMQCRDACQPGEYIAEICNNFMTSDIQCEPVRIVCEYVYIFTYVQMYVLCIFMRHMISAFRKITSIYATLFKLWGVLWAGVAIFIYTCV